MRPPAPPAMSLFMCQKVPKWAPKVTFCKQKLHPPRCEQPTGPRGSYQQVIHRLSTGLSTRYPQVIHRLSTGYPHALSTCYPQVLCRWVICRQKLHVVKSYTSEGDSRGLRDTHRTQKEDGGRHGREPYGDNRGHYWRGTREAQGEAHEDRPTI